jgi:N-dimethylarginine dimethylaminohydrolase
MTTLALPAQSRDGGRVARPRRYLMCRPDHFAVTYAINPWMDPTAPVDRDLAITQWEALRRTYEDLGHEVELIDPIAGLPDMVFAANGGTVIGGRTLAARFVFAEREPEAAAYARRLGGAIQTVARNEGEGDLLLVGDLLLAGTGFRTDHAAHAEAQEYFGLPVVTLQLVDPHYYHLDTALAVLDDHEVAYLPQAFSRGSQAVLRRLFPDAVIASPGDAALLGLNAVSDGRHVVMAAGADALAAQLRARGYLPVPVDLSELRKAGGGAKCCTLELRP